MLTALTLLLPAAGSARSAERFEVGSDVFAGMGFLLRTSIERGGGELVTVSGAGNGSASLTGGAGTSIELGARLDLRPFERPAFETELTLGLKRATLETGGGTVDFSRLTIALSQFYRFKSGWRVGAGAGLPLSRTLDIDVPGYEADTASIDGSPEFRAMIEYGFARWFAIGARVRQTSWRTSGESVEGSSAGLYLTVQQR